MPLLRPPVNAPASAVQFGNESIQASVTPVLSGVRAGSLLQLVDLSTGIDLAGGYQFGGVQCGSFVTMNGAVLALSDSEVVFSSPGMVDLGTLEELPVSVSIVYRLDGRSLEMEFTIQATAETELENPLEVDFSAAGYCDAAFVNQSGTDRTIALDGTHGTLRISGDQLVSMNRSDGLLSAQFLAPNPSCGPLVLNDDPVPTSRYLTYRFLDTEPPRENCEGPWLHSILPAGFTARAFFRLSFDGEKTQMFLSGHPSGLERSASWIFDDIPFRHPPDTTLWAYSETSGGGEYCSAWLIALLEAHPGMKMNWVILPDGILGPNCDSMWAEPGFEDSWSHWHSTWRVATLAPPDFLLWLQNIQNGVYPWASRVSLGSHGYHHTPAPDSAWDPYHEFITFEPEEHMERFLVARQDFAAMGLDTSRISAIRYPGHRTSLSGLYAAIRYGFDFCCNGVRWYEWMGGEPFWDQYLSYYVTPDGDMRGSNTVWWGDYQSAYPYGYLSTVMQRGKHALLGGHPSQMWGNGNPAAYARIDSVCTSLENDYANFGWLLPEEYGAFLDETGSIAFDDCSETPGQACVTFTGGTSRGETMVALLKTGSGVDQVYLDGVPAQWEIRGTRLFADIDGLTPGIHQLVIDFTLVGTGEGRNDRVPPAGLSFSLSFPSPCAAPVEVSVQGAPPGSPVEAAVFDMAGRLAVEVAAVTDGGGECTMLVGEAQQLPPGIYLIRAEAPGLPAASASVVILH